MALKELHPTDMYEGIDNFLNLNPNPDAFELAKRILSFLENFNTDDLMVIYAEDVNYVSSTIFYGGACIARLLMYRTDCLYRINSILDVDRFSDSIIDLVE